jgi:predicted nucleic acid-binding Zn ribbon protein
MLSRPKSMQDVMQGLINRMHLQPKVQEVEVVETWAELAGPKICSVVDSAWFRDGQLVVKVKSAAWRNTLHIQRLAWRDRLNEALQDHVVKEVVFR